MNSEDFIGIYSQQQSEIARSIAILKPLLNTRLYNKLDVVLYSREVKN